jgi:hypothetical protein
MRECGLINLGYFLTMHCLQVYERRLTALVLGGKYASTYADADSYYNDGDTLDEDDDSDSEVYDINGKRVRGVVRFGEHGKGKLFSVSCR